MSISNLTLFLEKKSIRAEALDDYELLEVLGVSNKVGITTTDHKKSKDLSKYQLVEEGDFAYNPYRINVGSIGLVPDGVRGLVSPAYVVFKTNGDLLSELLFDFLKSNEGLFQIGKYARGTVRKALRFEDLCKIEMSVPTINRQKSILKKKESVEIEVGDLKTELTHQETLLKKLRQQILQEAIEGKLTANWRKQHKLSPCQGGVPRSGEGVKPINNLPHLKTFRKTLRKNLTPAEAKLWTMLKGKQLQGRKFRRQHSVANYILDFYCPAENLAIELDGEVHNNPAAAECDRERDIFLAYTGIKVLRFENKFVFNNPDGLLAYIQQHFNSDSFPDPSAPSNPSAPSGHLHLSGEEYEHASELLKRIQAEKAQLIKDKKIKKQKPLPPISEKEKPFELPDGWVWCRLGDITINSLGKMLDAQKNRGELKSYLRNLNIQWFKINVADLKQMPFEEHETEKYSVIQGDIVICEGGYPGQSAIWNKKEPIMFQKALHRVRFILGCFPSDLFVHLLWLWDSNGEIKKYFTGAGIKHLTGKKLNLMLIPIPPLLEQKAIVAKVEKLLTLCDQLETQITDNQAHAKQLMQAVLKEAFSRNV